MQKGGKELSQYKNATKIFIQKENLYVKKMVFISIALGVFLFSRGIWTIESYNPLKYWRYSSHMRTLIEIEPWFMSMLGALGVIVGIFYLVVDARPMKNDSSRVIEKNGTSVVLEFDNGSRKNLKVLGKVYLAVGDKGIAEYKGNLLLGFRK